VLEYDFQPTIELGPSLKQKISKQDRFSKYRYVVIFQQHLGRYRCLNIACATKSLVCTMSSSSKLTVCEIEFAVVVYCCLIYRLLLHNSHTLRLHSRNSHQSTVHNFRDTL